MGGGITKTMSEESKPEEPKPAGESHEPAWLTNFAQKRPDFVLMAPFMAYLLMLLTKDPLPESLMPS